MKVDGWSVPLNMKNGAHIKLERLEGEWSITLQTSMNVLTTDGPCDGAVLMLTDHQLSGLDIESYARSNNINVVSLTH